MIPLFSSDFSIGRSILKVKSSGGPDSILDIAKENSLEEVFLVEDSMIGFLDSFKIFSANDIALRYGVRFNMCNNVEDEKVEDSSYKIVLFALNDEGCKSLYKIYSIAHTKHNSFLDQKILKENMSDNLLIFHPFYNSYIYNNLFYFKNCIYEKVSDQEYYTIEDNNLPFDNMLLNNISKLGLPTTKTKTILYKNKEDVEAYQVYRMSCNRSFGKSRSLSSPSLDHFSSDEFCWESYMEKINGVAV